MLLLVREGGKLLLRQQLNQNCSTSTEQYIRNERQALKTMSEPSTVHVVALLPTHEDRLSLAAIFHRCCWRVEFRERLADTRVLLDESEADVIITACGLPDASWKDVLREIQWRNVRLPVIVASRFADDRLWAEVLNLGGYDVLATPFVAKEVLHSVTLAWRQSRDKPVAAFRREPGRGISGDKTTAADRHLFRMSRSL